jgi:prepilin-type N-terminal cleavage/methylation domain-containing protein
MKSTRCHYSGFTLVELLVVIAIIAILAAVLSVSAGAAINAAKRAKAGSQANQIQTAILNYYTEYSVYPLPTGQTTDILEGSNGTLDSNEGPNALFYALCGNINAYSPSTPTNNGSVSNTRNIAFLTPKRSEVDNNGVMINPFSHNGTYYYFSIAIDGDYSGILGDSGSAAGALPNFTGWTNNSGITYLTTGSGITQGAAVWTCCDPTNLATWTSSKSPSYWVHTY